MNPEDRITTGELLASIHALADDLGRTPTAQEYQDQGRYSLHPIRRAFGRWNRALDAAGLERNAEYDIGEDRLISDLLRVARELDDTPTRRQYRDRGEFSDSTLQSEFGSWKNAVHEAGLEVKGSEPRAGLDNAQRRNLLSYAEWRNSGGRLPITEGSES